MSFMAKREVLNLYRSLLRYGNKLELTDKGYFKRRIRKEFEQNRTLGSESDTRFHIERPYISKKQEGDMIFQHLFPFASSLRCLHQQPYFKNILVRNSILNVTQMKCNSIFMIVKMKHTIDRSNVPTLNEDDLEEQFVRGHGPGGSNVNKRSNCVVLIHRPTGIVIKCHQSRLLDKNRQIARELLIEKLDQEINGENSVASQTKLLLAKKSTEKERRRKKVDLLKTAWKEREGL